MTDNKYQNAPSLKPAGPTSGIMFKAIDLNATNGPRTHNFVEENGAVSQYTFPSHTTAVPVSFAAAMRLVTIDGFKVLDQSGKEFKPAKRDDTAVVLGMDETVARYTELTTDALKARCALAKVELPEKPKKEDYITALIQAGAPVLGQAAKPGEGNVLTGDEESLIEDDEEEAA